MAQAESGKRPTMVAQGHAAERLDGRVARGHGGTGRPEKARRCAKDAGGLSPGGVSDLVARALAKEMADQRQAQVIVENRSGASGTLALELLQRSPPDGQMLVFTAAAALGLLRHAAARRARAPGVQRHCPCSPWRVSCARRCCWWAPPRSHPLRSPT